MSETHSPVGVITIQRLLPFASWARMGTIGQERQLTSKESGHSTAEFDRHAAELRREAGRPLASFMAQCRSVSESNDLLDPLLASRALVGICQPLVRKHFLHPFDRHEVGFHKGTESVEGNDVQVRDPETRACHLGTHFVVLSDEAGAPVHLRRV